MTQNALVPADINPVQLFSKNGLDPVLEEIQKKIEVFEPDVSTAMGRKEIASFAYKIAQSKTFIDKAGKELVAKQKAEIKLIDAERKRARDWLDEKKVSVRRPLTDYEEAEKRRIEEEQLQAEIASAHEEALAENELFDRQREIERKEAELARQEEERRQKEEAERLERERIEREERLKKEAAEKAKREAEEKIRREKEEKERIEREAKEAAEKAERDRIAAEERAKIEKEMAVKRATEEAEAKARAEREAEERRRAELKAFEIRKAANKWHQASINNKILNAFESIGIDTETGKKIITEIVRGNIPGVSINY